VNGLQEDKGPKIWRRKERWRGELNVSAGRRKTKRKFAVISFRVTWTKGTEEQKSQTR